MTGSLAAALGGVWGVLGGAAVAVLAAMIHAGASARARRAAESMCQRLRIDAAGAAARIEGQAARLVQIAEERDNLTDALHAANRDIGTLERALDAARLMAARDADLAAREVEALRAVRDEMTAQFRQMADESLRRQGADLERTHADRLAALLTPFREQVARFQDELQAGQRARETAQAMLREQIEGLHRRSEDIGRDAVALTRALKGDKQRQGAWGEMILGQVLEAAGLVPGRHYRLQPVTSDADGRRWRPDVVVDMPGGRSLVIDAKVSLNAYADACAAEDDLARDAALRRHVAALRAHVAELAGRGYHAVTPGSVDYVLMFLPIEGAFAEALRLDPQLIAHALGRRIGLATPSTLMVALRTVEHLWAVERRERGAELIAARAGALYDKLAGVVEALDDAGAALDAASRAQQTAIARLSRGPGNVIRQAQMLRELGARTTRSIDLPHDADADESDQPGNNPPHPELSAERSLS